MITLVTNVINFFTCIIKSVFVLTSSVGQVIVIATSSIISILVSTFQSVITFFKIIYEDNVFILTEDLPNLVDSIARAISNQWNNVQHSFIDTYSGTCSSFISVINTVSWFIYAICTIVREVFLLLKRALILFGATIWFLLTFIPIHLPLVLQEFYNNITNWITETVVDVYMVLLKLTNFLTDVPLESFIGITSAIVIVRLCVYFRGSINVYLHSLYWTIVRNSLYLYYVLCNYFMDSEVRLIARMAGNQQLQMRQMVAEALGEDEDIVSPAEVLCVVCQERQKCVLTLPCRHVCLCRDCCTRLYNYQRTCPICRTFIYHSVNIYL